MKSTTILKLYASVVLAAAAIAATLFAVAPAETHAARPSPPTAAARAAVEVRPTERVPTGLNTSPVMFEDCVAGGNDCCNPACKPALQACCVANGCGLPVAPVVKGKGPFQGRSVDCRKISITET